MVNYPKVLIITLGRINTVDNANNGLLLRNLFNSWPREALAQIFSSGDNGDEGFFGRYYQLGARDRYLGSLFYMLKTEAQAETTADKPHSSGMPQKRIGTLIKSWAKHLLVDTGFYELVFRPRISSALHAWIEDFRPDIIFAQGYCLTFSWLPIMIAARYQLPAAYYPTDDWPSAAYRTTKNRLPLLPFFVQGAVSSASQRLVQISSVRIAFNRYMREEYLQRYGKEFSVLMHGDDASRFKTVEPMRLSGSDHYTIVCSGIFDSSRLQLLNDLEQACAILSTRGLSVRATVFPINRLPCTQTNDFRYIRFEPCPSHDELAAVLKGADILFLPERFDETAQGIRLSVSSKAHLFMFSDKPIVVYSDPVTGIARYAEEEGWAIVVSKRDPYLLAMAFDKLLRSDAERDRILSRARDTAAKNHDLTTIKHNFVRLLNAATRK